MKGADFMGNNSENKPDRYINIGIVAHVDAGKTTLSESMLYHAGAIRKLGRVDHKDAFLDTDQMERERGITIFSKQAVFRWKDRTITLLDTPGHVDFSAEMERVLQVLDCAVLVVSGADGVQGHTQTLWKLLKRYHIPTFLFVNKMDQEGTDGEKLLKELRKRFGENVVPFVDIMTESDCPAGKLQKKRNALCKSYLQKLPPAASYGYLTTQKKTLRTMAVTSIWYISNVLSVVSYRNFKFLFYSYTIILLLSFSK